MTRVFRGIATLGILLIGFSGALAEAAPSNSCAKPGATKTVSGAQFRCVKQRGTLRWVRVPSVPVSTQDTPIISDPVPVWMQVALAIRKTATDSATGAINFDLHSQPSVDPQRVDAAVTELRNAYRPLSGKFPITRPFPVYIFDENGIGWMQEQVRAIGGNPTQIDDLFRRHPLTATTEASSIYFTSTGAPFKVSASVLRWS